VSRGLLVLRAQKGTRGFQARKDPKERSATRVLPGPQGPQGAQKIRVRLDHKEQRERQARPERKAGQGRKETPAHTARKGKQARPDQREKREKRGRSDLRALRAPRVEPHQRACMSPDTMPVATIALSPAGFYHMHGRVSFGFEGGRRRKHLVQQQLRSGAGTLYSAIG